MISWGCLCRDAVPTLPMTLGYIFNSALHSALDAVLNSVLHSVLPVAQRRGIHAIRAGLAEREGTGIQSRAGGEDVVDDDIADRRVDGLSVGEHEGPGDILPALLPAEPGLRDGVMLLAEKRLGSAAGDEGGEPAGNPFSLIVAAVPSSRGVQRDGDQDRAGQMAAEDFVFDGRRGKVVGQERAPFVFDAVDDPAGGSAGTEGADRPAERRPEVEAVRAGPVAFEDAFEGMAAGQAAWVADSRE